MDMANVLSVGTSSLLLDEYLVSNSSLTPTGAAAQEEEEEEQKGRDKAP